MSQAGDGFNCTITLDCGCQERLNGSPFQPGDWTSCEAHSPLIRCDEATGVPTYKRDRRVIAVEIDSQTSEGPEADQ